MMGNSLDTANPSVFIEVVRFVYLINYNQVHIPRIKHTRIKENKDSEGTFNRDIKPPLTC